MQGTCANGVKLNTSLREFGERRSESRLILQRNAVDGPKTKAATSTIVTRLR